MSEQKYVTETLTSDGITVTSIIDLAENPLTYGDKDKLSAKVRKTAENFENTHYQSPVEYAILIASTGKVLQYAKGDATNVQTKTKYWRKAMAFTHVHPKDQGLLGGTFSMKDFEPFVKYGVKTIRATTKEGTYSLTKGKTFDGKGLKNYYALKYLSADLTAQGRVFLTNKAYKKGEISHAAQIIANNKHENARFVELHNALLEGQTIYGYEYTLEKRQ